MAERNKDVSALRAATLALTVMEELDRVTGQSPLAPSRARVLLYLYANGPTHQQKLVEVAGTEKSAASTTVQILGGGTSKVAGMGMVEKETDYNDQRLLLVRLTSKGKTLMDDALAKAASALN